MAVNKDFKRDWTNEVMLFLALLVVGALVFLTPNKETNKLRDAYVEGCVNGHTASVQTDICNARALKKYP